MSMDFMEVAIKHANKSKCLRRKVGAIIVRKYSGRILGYGRNSAPNGCKSCEEIGGCIRVQKQIPSGERHEVCRAVHAEQDAIINVCIENEYDLNNTVMYVTHQPCSICAKLIINAGIEKVVYKEGYPDELAVELFKESGVELIKHG